MNKFNLVVALVVAVIGLSSCSVGLGKDTSDRTDKAIKKMNDDNKKLIADLDDIIKNAIFTAGGQPGKITVSGIVVKESEKKVILDDRLSILQTPGKSRNKALTVITSESNKPVLKAFGTGDELEKVSSSTSYMNLGCAKLDPKQIQGLTELKLDLNTKVVSASAKKVFICGDFETSLSVLISADSIIFDNANFVQTGFMDVMTTIRTKAITLIGNNRIKTKGISSSGIVLGAPAIDLVVAKDIFGEGTLEINSEGGECLPAAVKE